MENIVPFLILIRSKVDQVIPEISINTPLLEISAMLTAKIEELENETKIGDLE